MQLNFDMFLRDFRILLALLILGLSHSVSAYSKIEKEIIGVEKEIEKGELWKAEHHLFNIKRDFKETNLQSYYSTKLLSKIYCTQQDFIHYKKSTEELVHCARKLDPIYLSEAYAQKAYYWHFMMWSDSALYYSNVSFDLLAKHRSDFDKIDPAFVYEIYAITYLYRRDKLKINAYNEYELDDYQRKQFFYFDSCLIIQKKYPFKFSSEKAMYYRSYGNRLLDLVSSYRVFSKDEAKHFSERQWFGFNHANQLYNKGLECVKPWHKNDLLALKALKAMNYTMVGEWKIAENIFNSVYDVIPLSELMNRMHVALNPLKVFLTFKIRNTIQLPYNKANVDRDIRILQTLKKEFWGSFFSGCDLPYDPYRISPYVDLFTLYYFKSLHETNSTNLVYRAVSNLLTMKSYFHFIRHGIHKSFQELPYFSVKKIQEKLKENEAYLLFQNDADFLKDKKILITRHRIHFVNVLHRARLTNENLDKISLTKFKYLSYIDYKENFEQIKKLFPSIKKMYICYDDPNPYEIFIKNTKGLNYTQLNYLGNEINFVRIYNPVSYFTESCSTKYSKLDARFLEQKKSSHLLFTNDYFNQIEFLPNYTWKKYTGNLNSLLNQKGILHLYGHGELALNKASNTRSFQWSYLKNEKLQFVKRVSGEFPVSRDLVVLNQCYSGYSELNLNEFNRTIPLRIMSNGAKAVISSPQLVDDYYSAEFFNSFYQKIMDNALFEDAFYEARIEFFQNHPELNNPKFWNSLQLFESYKLRYETTDFGRLLPLFLLTCCIDLLLTFLNAHVKKKQSTHQ